MQARCKFCGCELAAPESFVSDPAASLLAVAMVAVMHLQREHPMEQQTILDTVGTAGMLAAADCCVSDDPQLFAARASLRATIVPALTGLLAHEPEPVTLTPAADIAPRRRRRFPGRLFF